MCSSDLELTHPLAEEFIPDTRLPPPLTANDNNSSLSTARLSQAAVSRPRDVGSRQNVEPGQMRPLLALEQLAIHGPRLGRPPFHGEVIVEPDEPLLDCTTATTLPCGQPAAPIISLATRHLSGSTC